MYTYLVFYGNTALMADAVAEGVESVDGMDAAMAYVRDTFSPLISSIRIRSGMRTK